MVPMVQVVAVRVGLAGQHLGYHHVLQSAFDAFYLLYAFNLQSAEGEQFVKFVGGEVGVDVLTQPFVRYFHLLLFFYCFNSYSLYCLVASVFSVYSSCGTASRPSVSRCRGSASGRFCRSMRVRSMCFSR